ncbi:MAG: 16S rRNA (guanine(527)-N(7))-methyltransferase RsmG [Pirellulales bacterium]|nr:16S rRNA (guanine(527)-N(7))-methyltransferase RsmG [Pirellulales bacterium]
MDTLSQTLDQFDLKFNLATIALLDRYREQLWMWNERMNLTRHTTFEKFVCRDVLDSMKLSELLPAGECVLDVGTGGGVPGLVMAILRPDLVIRLCESVAKKARAVEAIVAALGMEVPVYHARAEDLLETQTFDTLVVRAVAPLPKLVLWFEPHWASFHQLLVVKGKAWIQERAEARQRGLFSRLNLRRVSVYKMPDTSVESVILRIWPKEIE